MHFVRFFTCIVSCLPVARAFSVTVGAATQCDPLNISWTGGQAPFEILLTPSLETCQNYSIPTSAFSNGKGSYSIPQLSLSTGTQFLLTMSDATGFGSGGTTNTLIVGNQVGNNDCSTTVLSPPYTFELSPLPLTQCSPFTVAVGSGAILPITIVQLMPGGQSVIFTSSTSSFTSVIDVSAETNLMYFVTDSAGRPGGISGFQQVLGSSNISCLNANSPSTTAGMSATTTATPSPTSSSSSSSGGPSISATGGGAAVLIALAILSLCLWRKRTTSRPLDVQSSTKSHARRLQRTDPEYEVGPYGDIPPESPFPYKTNTINYHTRPNQASLRTQSDMTNSSAVNFAVGAPPSSFHQLQHSRQSSNTDSPAYGNARSSTMSSAYNRMAALSHPMTLNYPTQYPVGYPLPIRPGSQSPPLNASTGNPTISDLPTQFSQTLHSRQSSSDFDPYVDARSSAMSSADRRLATVAETSPSLSWETDPVSYRGPPIQSGSQPSPMNVSPTNLVARDLPAPFNQTQPSSTDFTQFGVNVDARISDMTPIEHMAVGPRPASPLPRKTDLVYLAPPIQPGSKPISTSTFTSKIAVNHSPTLVNQTQNFNKSLDTDAGSQSVASARVQAATAAVGQTNYQLPTQAIMHTDAGDIIPGVNGLVELPPQYSEHHGVRAM
ncbi:hypothetical protein BDR04DRAFT_852600 [Suillus decipiens]|nr:hypothetical protein BDR04DRAFT_852600 [Suillus decipiens]